MNMPVEYSYAATSVTLLVPEVLLTDLTMPEIKRSFAKLLNFIFFCDQQYCTAMLTESELIQLITHDLETRLMVGYVPNPVLFQPMMLELYGEYGPDAENLRESLHKISTHRNARRMMIRFLSDPKGRTGVPGGKTGVKLEPIMAPRPVMPVSPPVLPIPARPTLEPLRSRMFAGDATKIAECAQQLFEEPVVQTFASALRPDARSAVEIDIKFLYLCVTCVFQFTRDLWGQGRVGNFSRYYHKYTLVEGQPLHRSFLIFVTMDEPETVCVLIKSKEGTQVRHHAGRGLYHAQGAYKTVKIFGLLCKFQMRLSLDLGGSIEVIDRPSVEDVVTFSRPTPFVAPETGVTGALKKESLQAELARNPRDYFEWSFLEFFDSGKHVWRLIGLQKKAGYPCGTHGKPICDWSKEQIFVGILTFLDAVKNLLQQGIWPSDLKFDNMCIRQIGAFFKLELIDIGGAVFSVSLYKTLAHRVMHPSGLFDTTGREFRKIILRLNARRDINVQSIYLILHQLCFELMYNIFFILNPFCTPHLYLMAWWNREWPTRHTFRNYVKTLPLHRLLLKYMYDLEPIPNISNFLDELATSLSAYRPEGLPTSYPYHHVLFTPEWRAEFIAAIDNFPHTESPLRHGARAHTFIDLPTSAR